MIGNASAGSARDPLPILAFNDFSSAAVGAGSGKKMNPPNNTP